MYINVHTVLIFSDIVVCLTIMTDLAASSEIVCPAENREATGMAATAGAEEGIGWMRLISTHSAVGTCTEGKRRSTRKANRLFGCSFGFANLGAHHGFLW